MNKIIISILISAIIISLAIVYENTPKKNQCLITDAMCYNV